jgi:hypothetical protein
MTPDTTRPHTRRDVLKFTGSAAIAAVLAGCNELSGEEDDDTGESDPGGDDTPPDDGGSTRTTTATGTPPDAGGPYAVDPAAFAEGADGRVRAAAVDPDHATVAQPAPGFDAETDVVAYGHDAGKDGTDPGTPEKFGFGVVTTPVTGADGGENPLGTLPFVELLTGEEGALVRRAIGLGAEPALVADPDDHGVPERRAEIVALREQGLTYSEIVDATGDDGPNHRGDVSTHLKRFNVQLGNANWLAENADSFDVGR